MKDDIHIKEIISFSKEIRKKIIQMSLKAGSASAHIGGALSIADIVSVLFKYQMKNFDKSIERDRFILSKGHACLAYYSALNLIGLISDTEIETFEKNNSNLAGHPVKNRKLGIDFSNGSLGMGLSIAIGLAISSKKKKENFRVYVIMGDGECNEGSVWEAAMSAPNFKLDNLCVIIDKNNFQQTGTNKEIMNTESLSEKWKSFGWEVSEANGHDIIELFNFFEKKSPKPKLLIANTVKGKGISFSENNNDWHHAVLTKNFYEKALNELETKYK